MPLARLALSRLICLDRRTVPLGQQARLSVEPTAPLLYPVVVLHHLAILLDQRRVLLV